jgi:hypothetical protein
MKRGMTSSGWLAFCLAPAIGELLSGSSPPLQFFNPPTFLLLAVLYGGGAILIRETVFRWGKGWTSIFILGAAYGMAEEGLAVKSFFDPHWKDLGPLAHYGRWAGVNWVWSLQLTLYHAVVSIAIPLLLVQLAYPDQRDRPWTTKRAFKVLLILFLADIALCFFAITPYRPPLVPYLLTLLLILGLYFLAERAPTPSFPRQTGTVARPLFFYFAGFAGILIYFVFSWILPNTPLSPVWDLLLSAAWALGMAWFVSSRSGGGSSWTEFHQFMLAAGALAFFILLALLMEIRPHPPARAGMGLTGLAAAFLLFRLGRKIAARRRSDPQEVLRVSPGV